MQYTDYHKALLAFVFSGFFIFLSFHLPERSLAGSVRGVRTVATSSAMTVDDVIAKAQELVDENNNLQSQVQELQSEVQFIQALHRGSGGQHVVQLQTWLSDALSLNPPLNPSGYFGKSTETAVKSFQAAASLPVTGIADSDTLHALAAQIMPEISAPAATAGSDLMDSLHELGLSCNQANAGSTSPAADTVALDIPSASTTPAAATLQACPAGCVFQADANSACSSPDTASLNSGVDTAAGSGIRPAGNPIIALAPASLQFSGSVGSAPASQTATIANTGTVPLSWTAGSPAAKTGTWCNISPAAGSVNPNTSQTVTISVQSQSKAGTLSDCGIEIADPNAPNSPQNFSLSYQVLPACPAGAVSLNPNLILVGKTSAASAPSGFSGGTFFSNSSNAKISGATITGAAAGTAIISGSGWKYTTGAVNCPLSGAPLSIH